MNKPQPPMDLWEQLDQLEPPVEQPPDTFTVAQYADKRGVARRTAQGRIDLLVKRGIIEQAGTIGSKGAKLYRIKEQG